MNFKVEKRTLPHQGIIPGARGHKKITIPSGTEVFCIMHERKFFWACYLNQPDAEKVANSLEDSVAGRARRNIDLPNMLAWNFKTAFPMRVDRPKS